MRDGFTNELVERNEERFRFQPVGSMQAGAGSAGSLIPPHEYHTIRNPSDSGVAVSLHIYKGTMTCCSVFRALEEPLVATPVTAAPATANMRPTMNIIGSTKPVAMMTSWRIHPMA